MAYYYLAAQLPSLSYGQAAPMSSDAYIKLCGEKLSKADTELLKLCSLDPAPLSGTAPEGDGFGRSYSEAPAPCSSPLIDRWRIWERALRLNLARFRIQKFKREGAVSFEAPEDPADAAAVAKAAFAMESPLEAEIFLDESRWKAIEAFQGIDYFSRDTLYAYLLKLLIMERQALFKAEDGFAEYKGLYEAVMDASAGNE
ncbi:MAG: DUF2764 domain-containing protein [Treponema sp.]|nr:DUF2764 domain-containing protein [Treponema sp.]